MKQLLRKNIFTILFSFLWAYGGYFLSYYLYTNNLQQIGSIVTFPYYLLISILSFVNPGASGVGVMLVGYLFGIVLCPIIAFLVISFFKKLSYRFSTRLKFLFVFLAILILFLTTVIIDNLIFLRKYNYMLGMLNRVSLSLQVEPFSKIVTKVDCGFAPCVDKGYILYKSNQKEIDQANRNLKKILLNLGGSCTQKTSKEITVTISEMCLVNEYSIRTLFYQKKDTMQKVNNQQKKENLLQNIHDDEFLYGVQIQAR